MEVLVDDLGIVDDQVDRSFRAADLLDTTPQLGRFPFDVILIAKGDPVGRAAARRADEILAEAESRFVPVEMDREGRARGEFADDLLGGIESSRRHPMSRNLERPHSSCAARLSKQPAMKRAPSNVAMAMEIAVMLPWWR